MSSTLSATRPTRRAQLRHAAHAVLAIHHVPSPRLRLLRDRDKVLFAVDAAGHRSVVRLDPSDRLPLPLVEAELAWLTLLYHESRLPVPCPLPAPDGRLIIPAADPAGAWHGIRLRWTPGHVRSRRVTRADAHALGALLAQLHRVATQHSDPSRFPRWNYNWDEVFGAERPVAQPDRSPYDGRDQSIITAVGAHLQAVLRALGTGAAEYGMIHGDVNLTNVVWSAAGPALLDFDYCAYGFYLWDLGRAALQLRLLGTPGEGLRRALVDGYAQAAGQAPAPQQIAAFEAINVVDTVNWLLEIPVSPPWKASYLKAAPQLLSILLDEATA